jgi:tetratricopeptide (TPR) repeat protein
VAQADFRQLKALASGNEELRDLLPAWERVERGLEELQACHAEVVTQPTSVSPRLKRALLCVRLGLWENAHEDLREALRLNKRVLTPLVLLASLNPYEPNENEGLLTRSHPQLSSSPVLETWMSNHRSHGTEWNSLINKDEQVALSAGKESQELFTHLAERAYLVCVLGRPALALSEAKSLLERAPDNLPAHRIIIQALLAQKHVAAAGAALTQALQFAPRKADPEDLELQRLAGLVWQAQGRHAEAVEAFAACLAKIPSAELLQARAESLRYLQRFQEAAQDLAKAESAKAPEQKEQQP